MLVPPISIVSNRVLNELPDERKHFLITDACNETIDSLLSEGHIVFVLLLAREAFPRSDPVIIDVLVDVNHKLEDHSLCS